jgi:hypothetical protein
LRFRPPGEILSGWRFRALFWALNFALLRSRSRAFALLVFRARIFALLDFRARTFALLISFRATDFLSRSRFPFTHVCLYIYTHTHMHTSPHISIHPHAHMYIQPTHIHTYTPTHIHTPPHTYIHPHIHTYIQKYIHTYKRSPQDKKARICAFFLSRSALSLFFALFFLRALALFI